MVASQINLNALKEGKILLLFLNAFNFSRYRWVYFRSNLIYSICFFLGIGTLLPYNFFINANEVRQNIDKLSKLLTKFETLSISNINFAMWVWTQVKMLTKQLICSTFLSIPWMWLQILRLHWAFYGLPYTALRFQWTWESRHL